MKRKFQERNDITDVSAIPVNLIDKANEDLKKW